MIKTIADYKSTKGVETMNQILHTFGVQSSHPHLKQIANALYEVRNTIKRTNKDLLDVLDDEHMKFGSIFYAILLFYVDTNTGWSKDGRNNTANFTRFLTNVLSAKDKVEASSFLCAHRERGSAIPERKHHLASKINTKTFARLQNAIL
jgi:hypothetical protein